jgi:hypothetical protein
MPTRRLALVIVCLVASSLPAGCATIGGPHRVAAGTPSESDWSRVGELAPGAEIAVTIRGSPSGSRYFVRTDQSAITVLNLTGPTLPDTARRALRELASRGLLAGIQQSGTLQQDKVSVGRDGVFVANRRVADLGQVVTTIARTDVATIRGPVVARGSVLGTVLGGWLGFSIGVVPALGGASAAVAWPVLIGSVAAGAFLGSHWSSHETEGVIYRAP